MGIKEWLIPQDKIFFSLLEEESQHVVKGVTTLLQFLKKYNGVEKVRKIIKDEEHESDNIVHQIYEKLSSTFITPIDHEDIASLAYMYDDVIDYTYGIINQLYLYRIKKPTVAMEKFAQILLSQVKEIDSALHLLKKLNRKKIENSCIEVHRLENAADKLLDKTIASLFESDDAKEIIKLKGIYDFFEMATDKCENLSDLLRNIVMKNL